MKIEIEKLHHLKFLEKVSAKNYIAFILYTNLSIIFPQIIHVGNQCKAKSGFLQHQQHSKELAKYTKHKVLQIEFLRTSENKFGARKDVISSATISEALTDGYF